jgi:hypothetical protein
MAAEPKLAALMAEPKFAAVMAQPDLRDQFISAVVQ